MTKEEMQMFQTIFKLGIGECYSEDIKKYGQLDKKILNVLEQQKERIAYLESNWNELKEFIKEQYILIENEKRSNYIDGCYDELGVIAMKVEEIESRK